MKNLSKIVVGLFIFSLGSAMSFALSIVYFNDANTFPDWAKQGIFNMHQKEIIKGYEDNTFRADDFVSRAELATILDRYDKANTEKVENAVLAAARLSEMENLKDIPPHIKAMTALVKNYYEKIDGKPELFDEENPIVLDLMPDGEYEHRYEFYERPFSGYYIRYVYTGGFPESDEKTNYDFWYKSPELGGVMNL